MAWFRAVRRRWPLVVVLGIAVLGLGLSFWWLGRSQHASPPDSPRSEDPHPYAGAIARGQGYLQQGRPDLAWQAVADVPDDGPGAAQAWTVKGLALASFNQVGAARRALERALELEPHQPMAAKVLAAIYFSTSDANRGLAMLQWAAQLDPDDFRPWFAMGDAYQRLSQPDEAVRAFQEALQRQPAHWESRIGLVEALLANNDPETARVWLDPLLHEHPDDPQVLSLAARQARVSGRTDEARHHAERCLSLDPDNLDALLVRARVARSAGQPDQALSDLERAVALKPDSLEALHLLGQVEAQLGLDERAEATIAQHKKVTERAGIMAELTQRIEQKPDDPEPRWRLGQVALQWGEMVLARQSFQAALDLDPDCQPAREGLAAVSGSPSPLAPPLDERGDDVSARR